MSDFLAAYSIQNWLESCPQGYLENTEYGHQVGEKESSAIIEAPVLREQAIRTTVQLVVGERCAIPVPDALSLRSVCPVGCGVTTGFGAAVITGHSGVDYGMLLDNIPVVLDTRNVYKGNESAKIIRL